MSALISQLNHFANSKELIINFLSISLLIVLVLFIAGLYVVQVKDNLVCSSVLIIIGVIVFLYSVLIMPDSYNHRCYQKQQQVMQTISKKEPIMTVINGKYVTFDIPKDKQIKKNQSVKTEYTLGKTSVFLPSNQSEQLITLTKKQTPIQVNAKSVKQYYTKDYLK